MKLKPLVFALCLSLSAAAQVDTPANNMDTRARVSETLIRAQKKLDSTYAQAISYLDSATTDDSAEYKNMLTTAQNAWEAYSENQCLMIGFESRFAAQGGTVFYQSCLADIYSRRQLELEDILEYIRIEFGE